MIDTSATSYCEWSGLSYAEAGNGDRHMLLLHGWADTHAIWRLTAGEFARHWHLVMPDLPGHGETPLGGNAGMAAIAGVVGRFCDAHGIDTAVVVGHSMGGNIAVELALRRPDLVRQLVLVAPATLGAALPITRPAYHAGALEWAALRMLFASSRVLGRFGELLRDDGPLPAPMSLMRRARHTRHHSLDSLPRLLGALLENPIVERLGDLRVPTLVISGAFDTVVPVAHSRRVAAAIPGARLVLIPGTMHHPMDEAPGAFSRALAGWLAESG
ncbi:MAG TPA: alpha/beta hydrolase [Roseiflexaceae bacterium]|nr:alpha/beta hydrolase [Roseiflexaceae bacterium]HMP41412.1 alpha/beta hydrolase [Roseiflexaceae bacterium]